MLGSRAVGRIALGFLALVLGTALVCAQGGNPNETHIKPGINVLDKDTEKTVGLWTLDFKFKDPRLIKVNIPGKGTRVCWYLWYQVINYTGEPRTFIPQFELFTHDTRMSYPDQILPSAFEAIKKLEDPTSALKIKNSVTIAADPIPVSAKEKADPRPVTGVAMWIDPDEVDPDDDAATKARKERLKKDGKLLSDSNRYSIFVAGLSNGFTKIDGDASDPRPVVVRKTLQLPFRRFGDKVLMKSDAIRFQPPAGWIYRASKIKLEASAAASPKAVEK
ncbi:MAG: hypothetical protein ACRC33_21170 [Gemmataceae bacterium]